MDLVAAIISEHMSLDTLRGVNRCVLSRLGKTPGALDPIMKLLGTTAEQLLATTVQGRNFYQYAEFDHPISASRRTHEGVVISTMMESVLECVVLPAVQSSAELPPDSDIPRVIRRILLDGGPEFSAFYVENGATMCTSVTAGEANGAHAVVPDSGASFYFVQLLNRFGNIGGYDAVLSRVEDASIPISLSELHAYAVIFSVGRYCHTSKWFARFWDRTVSAFWRRLDHGISLTGDNEEDAFGHVQRTVCRFNHVIAYLSDVATSFVTFASPSTCFVNIKWANGPRCAWLSTTVMY